MRPIPLALALFAGLAGLPILAAAQDSKPVVSAASASQEGLPTGAALFARHVEAVGGEAALRAERNRVAKFKQDVKIPGKTMSGIVTVSRVAPNKMYLIMDFPGEFTLETWCDGENAWERHSHTGTKRFSGDQLERRKRDADILGEANYKNRYKDLTTLERTTFADRPAYAVKAVSAAGPESTAFFDAESGFLIGLRTQEGGKEVTVTFRDYKKFGGTLHAASTTQANGTAEVTMTLLSLEADKATPPNVDPPDEVKKVQ